MLQKNHVLNASLTVRQKKSLFESKNLHAQKTFSLKVVCWFNHRKYQTWICFVLLISKKGQPVKSEVLMKRNKITPTAGKIRIQRHETTEVLSLPALESFLSRCRIKLEYIAYLSINLMQKYV